MTRMGPNRENTPARIIETANAIQPSAKVTMANDFFFDVVDQATAMGYNRFGLTPIMSSASVRSAIPTPLTMALEAAGGRLGS